jgi:hypothetical protein
MAGGARSFRGGDVALDLVVDRLTDVTHGEVVVLNRAIAAIFAEQSSPWGSWKPEGVTASPGAGGAEACGAGALQAARTMLSGQEARA